MKIYKLILVLVVIGALGYASYLYMTRPVKGPSQNPPVENNLPEKYSEEEKANLYMISEGSEASYSIYEELSGEPVTVVGVTDQVFGDFVLDPEDIESSQIGKISLNARTFKTDNDRRDSAVVRYILHSEDEDKEFIEFDTTSITMTSESNLDIMGNLTVSGVTNPVTFAASYQMVSDDQIDITAEATINYKDFDLVIPELDFLANVADEIELKLNLIAKK